MKISFLPAFFLFAMVVGCKSSKDFPEHYKGDQIRFGQGGGFSGAVNEFTLLDDGRLFQHPWRDTNIVYVDRWESNFTKQLFHNYESLNLQRFSHNEPGDLYYFIDYQNKKSEHHRIVWGKPGFQADENVRDFYNLLYRSTKSKS